MWSAASVLLTSRPRMNTPVFPLRAGSLSAREHGPYRNASGVGGQSKLWVFLSCCRLLEVEQAGELRWRRLGLGELRPDWSEDPSEEKLRNRRWRRGVCWGGSGVDVERAGVELLPGGEEVLVSSTGQAGGEEFSQIPQSPDRDLLEEVELLLTSESERCLWVESRVLSAASIFLSNIFLVS